MALELSIIAMRTDMHNIFNLVTGERQRVLLKAVRQWRKRLRICIEEGKNVALNLDKLFHTD